MLYFTKGYYVLARDYGIRYFVLGNRYLGRACMNKCHTSNLSGGLFTCVLSITHIPYVYLDSNIMPRADSTINFYLWKLLSSTSSVGEVSKETHLGGVAGAWMLISQGHEPGYLATECRKQQRFFDFPTGIVDSVFIMCSRCFFCFFKNYAWLSSQCLY